jgi:group II intron reverse transcriptase/maturase
MDGRKAVGIDGTTKEEYAKDLLGNVEKLVSKLKRDSYNPNPSRRVRIPKPGRKGETRPLGISCYEDKLVESVVAERLAAVFEPKFMGFSYGFRPGRSCHDAIGALREIIMTKKVSFIVEADIKSFFDTMDHGCLMKFLRFYIADEKLMRLIEKFLKAGVMEQGEFVEKAEGSPQGSIMSPVLANVYLHFVLDVWFEYEFKRQCAGEAYMVRYADDNVWAFQNRSDAERFLKELKERLAGFGLEVAESKTRLLEFGRFAKQNSRKRGRGRPETFSFLGFTFYCGKAKFSEKFNLILRTDRKRIPSRLKGLKAWLMASRHRSVKELVGRAKAFLSGHFHYYGVATNVKQLSVMWWKVQRLLFKVLNRRSQKRSYNWESFRRKILEKFQWPEVKIHVRFQARF